MAANRAEHGGSLAIMSDCLSAKYSDMAKDRKVPPEAREAATLFTVAEGHLNDEDGAPALKLAEEARAKFQAIGDQRSAMDAFRIVAHVLIYQDKRQQADARARTELERIKSAEQRAGEAQVVLSLAEINCGGSGAGNEQALAHAVDAVKMFRTQGDKKMEANALLVESNLRARTAAKDSKQRAAEALEVATRARTIFKESGDRRGEAAALHGIALAYTRCLALGSQVDPLPGGWLGAVKEAIRLFQEAKLRKMEAFERICMARWLTMENPRKGLRAADEALAICIETGSAQEPAALSAVVQAHLAIRDISRAWMVKEAAEAAQKAKLGLVRFRARGDLFGEGQGLSALVLANIAKGDVAEALSAGDEAIRIFRQLEDSASESSMLQLLSGLYLKVGRTDLALQAAKQINALSQSLHERAVALETMYEVHIQNNDIGSARRAVNELLELCEERGDKKREGVARLMMSNVHFAEGDMSEAVAVAREAQAILNDAGAVKEEAHALRVVAEVHAAGSEPEAALRAAGKARKLLQQVGDQAEEAAVLFLIVQIRLMLLTGLAAAAEGDDKSAAALRDSAAEAVALGEEAVGIAAGLGNERLAGSALCVIAQLQMASAQIQEAQRSTDEAMVVFRNLGDERNQACVMCIQADIHLAFGKSQAALQLADKARKLFQEVGDPQGEVVARGIREHIAGPEVKEEVEQQWTEEEWARWEEWQKTQQQAQQPQAKPQQQQQAMPEALVQRKRRTDVDLGPKLDMSALNAGAITQKLSALVTSALDLDEDAEFSMDSPLMALGVTSRLAVELRNTMSEEFPGVSLPFTMVFDYPSIQNMAEMILDETGNPAG